MASTPPLRWPPAGASSSPSKSIGRTRLAAARPGAPSSSAGSVANALLRGRAAPRNINGSSKVIRATATDAEGAEEEARTAASSRPVAGSFADELQRFELLWPDVAAELGLGRRVSSWVARDVRARRLPPDAPLLRARIRELEAVSLRSLPALQPRMLLAAGNLALLQLDATAALAALRRVVQLLPGQDVNYLAACVARDLGNTPAEVLALRFAEADAACMAALGTHIPPTLFSYLLRLPGSSRSSRAARRRGGDPSATGSNSSFTMSQLQAALDGWVAGFGPEVALTALRRAPQLLELSAGDVTARRDSLAGILGLQGGGGSSWLELARLVEAAPSLLLTPPGTLEQRLAQLCQLLAWPRHEVVELVTNRPKVLAQSADASRAKWEAIGRVAALRPAWADELRACSRDLAAAVLLHNEDTYERLEFLADEAARGGGGGGGGVTRITELPRMKAVLEQSRAQFAARHPRFARWKRRSQRLLPLQRRQEQGASGAAYLQSLKGGASYTDVVGTTLEPLAADFFDSSEEGGEDEEEQAWDLQAGETFEALEAGESTFKERQRRRAGQEDVSRTQHQTPGRRTPSVPAATPRPQPAAPHKQPSRSRRRPASGLVVLPPDDD